LAGFGLGSASNVGAGQIYIEGSPIDGAFFSLLLLAGFIVLAHRSQQVLPLFPRMLPILIFFLYCGLSILWSDYPFVALKHWNKGIGDVVMVLIILTDPEPGAALKRLVSRVGFVLIPLSLLFSKYYPNLGRVFSVGGFTLYNGVTTQKNTLGVICLIFGLVSLWRILALYREVPRRAKMLLAHSTILALVVWLLWMCNSMTSITCFAMTGGFLLLANRPMVTRSRVVVHLLVAAMLGLSLFAVFFDSSGGIVEGLGRNPTLTGRTAIWDAVLPLAGNPLVGTGYESFWLGERLEKFWTANDGAFQGVQEAHNGYLELYLNLGWTGIALLGLMIVTGYPKAIALFRHDPAAGSLGIAFFVSELVYNLTEAGFRMMFPLWIFFLLTIIGVPKTADSEGPLELDPWESLDVPTAESEYALHVGSGKRIDGNLPM
jgi:O-antigen ligase